MLIGLLQRFLLRPALFGALLVTWVAGCRTGGRFNLLARDSPTTPSTTFPETEWSGGQAPTALAANADSSVASSSQLGSKRGTMPQPPSRSATPTAIASVAGGTRPPSYAAAIANRALPPGSTGVGGANGAGRASDAYGNPPSKPSGDVIAQVASTGPLSGITPPTGTSPSDAEPSGATPYGATAAAPPRGPASAYALPDDITSAEPSAIDLPPMTPPKTNIAASTSNEMTLPPLPPIPGVSADAKPTTALGSLAPTGQPDAAPPATPKDATTPKIAASPTNESIQTPVAKTASKFTTGDAAARTAVLPPADSINSGAAGGFLPGSLSKTTGGYPGATNKAGPTVPRDVNTTGSFYR